MQAEVKQYRGNKADSVRASRGQARANRDGVVPQVTFELGLKQESEAATGGAGTSVGRTRAAGALASRTSGASAGRPVWRAQRVDRTRGQCKACRPQ